MEIIGRDTEIARLDAALESSQSVMAKLLLEGEPGIGKTTLFAAAVDEAHERGYRVLATRPVEADRALPWMAVADLLTDVGKDALDDLPAPQRDALEIALLRRAVGEAAPDPRAVFTAFANVIRSLARDAPVVVAVDDLQWLDPPSARALEFFGRRATGTAVAVIATARVVDDSVQTANASWFGSDERLRLVPLSAAALHGLLQERLGVNLSRPAAIRLHRLCDGNAFYALEMARSTGGHLADARAEWPIPADVRDLVRSRVTAIDVTTRQALVLAAAAAQPDEALVGAGNVAAAEAAGLLRHERGRLRFVHPLYAEAVYATASPEERVTAHARLAERESDPAERGLHRGLATQEPDAAVAGELDAAAAYARSRGAFETAAELLERAIRLTPADPRRAGDVRRLAAASDWLGAGSLPRARALLDDLLCGDPDRRLRAQALRLLGLVHFREQSVPEAMALLQEAAAVAGDEADIRAPVELELAFLSVNVSFDFEAARPHADRALAFAEQVEDEAIVAQALAVKAIADFLLGDGVDEVRIVRALELEHACGPAVPPELRPSLIAGSLALYVGDPTEAVRLLASLVDRMREQGLDADLPFPLCYLSWACTWAGSLDAARAAADEALELARITRSDSLVGYAHAYAAVATAHSGQEGACRAHVAEALAAVERADYPVMAIWAMSACGLLELSRGDPAAAAATFGPLLDVFEGSPPPEPIRAFFVPDAVEALIGNGDLERASRLNELFGANARRSRRGWAIAASDRCRALIHAARGDLVSARRAVNDAIEAQRGSAIPLELARSLLVLGQIERREKHKAASRRALEEAAAICDGIGARRWAQRVRGELDRVGSAAMLDALSATEGRMAHLAASGLTNREIARAAFVSEKTVEANLSRVYRKLGVRSRTELTRRLDEGESPVA